MNTKIFFLIFFAQLFALKLLAQQDTDFVRFRKEADDCFNRRNFPCAIEKYNLALVINKGNKYCKDRLALSIKKAKDNKKKDKDPKTIAGTEKVEKKKGDGSNRTESAKAVTPVKPKEIETPLQPKPTEEAEVKRTVTEVKSKEEEKTIEQAKVQEIKKETFAAETEPKKQAEKVSTNENPLRISEANQSYKSALEKRKVKIIFSTAVLAASGTYAYVLQNKWKKQLTNLNTISATADPENDGKIDGADTYSSYQAAYSNAKNAQRKNSLFTALVSVSIIAGLYDTFAIIKKPTKPQRLTITPSSTGIGAAICYTF